MSVANEALPEVFETQQFSVRLRKYSGARCVVGDVVALDADCGEKPVEPGVDACSAMVAAPAGASVLAPTPEFEPAVVELAMAVLGTPVLAAFMRALLLRGER